MSYVDFRRFTVQRSDFTSARPLINTKDKTGINEVFLNLTFFHIVKAVCART